MKNKPVVAIIMTVRNEEDFIDFNISYHLDLGLDYIFLANHCSTDNTNKILESYKDNPRVVVINDTDPVFDHARIANNLLVFAKKNYKIDWFIFLDVDEFLSIEQENIHGFINNLESRNIPYATIGWTNALFDYTHQDYTCSPVNKIDTLKYYYPWPEKKWQEYGHFRKAVVKNHENMEVVVGGHYVKTENNPSFFKEFNWNPFIVPFNQAKLLHFEFRDTAEVLYKKWEKLANYENDSTSSLDAPWLERIQTIKGYVDEFKNNIDLINQKWFYKHSTFWGTEIPRDRIIYDTTLAVWYGRYVRRKLESGQVRSLCLVRSGNLGDVVMTEPVAKFLSKFVEKIILATDVLDYNKLNQTYDEVVSFNDAFISHKYDVVIKLVYEYSDNTKTYVQGFMESVGFADVIENNLPAIRTNFPEIISERYALVAPHTSGWEAQKRNWGYHNFCELSKKIESELKIKVITLENSHSFDEMLSLIKNCVFMVGNDSGPAIIAQSMAVTSFVIFGATQPKYLILSKKTFLIYDTHRHALCSHTTRQEEIDCCEPFCMSKIRINDVFGVIKEYYE